jgi:hypothetical protein
MEIWIHSRLEENDRRDELPSEKEISAALVPRTSLIQAHGINQEPNRLNPPRLPLWAEFVSALLSMSAIDNRRADQTMCESVYK